METAKAMGARFAVLTARHEEGFCLWPTKTTDYSISNSPYKEGKGDVVREFVDACRCYDIHPCLYHPSYFDAHHTLQPGDPSRWHKERFTSMQQRLADVDVAKRFTAMQVEQIHELLTQYGDISYLWLDHIAETQGILDAQAVEAFWKEIITEARRCQPKCLLLKADIFLSRDVDVQGGVHGGRASYPLWYASRHENQADGIGNIIMDPQNGYQYSLWESNTCFNGSWFWNSDAVKPIDDMMEHYYATIGRGSTFLPNFGPDQRGLMSEGVMTAATEFGNRIRQIYAKPLATVEDVEGDVDIVLSNNAFTHVEIMEDLAEGQKIAAYIIEILENGSWRELVSGQSVGYKRLHHFAAQTAERIRFRCTQSLAEPVQIRRFAVYV